MSRAFVKEISTALNTDMAGVIMASPKNRDAPANPTIKRPVRNGPAIGRARDRSAIVPPSPSLSALGHYCAVGADVETHSRNEDAVEETLQDRGKPLVPNRIDQDESFRSEQTIGIVLDWRAVQLEVMILDPLLLTHDRIEAFGIEITIIDFVAARP